MIFWNFKNIGIPLVFPTVIQFESVEGQYGIILQKAGEDNVEHFCRNSFKKCQDLFFGEKNLMKQVTIYM